MKTKRNLLTATVLAILLVSLAAPLVALPTLASDDEEDIKIEDLETHWKILKTDTITVLFPSSGRKPMFLWWYTNESDRIYVVKYQGLIEYFAFDHPLLPPKPEYYKRLREAWVYKFKEMYMKPLEDDFEMHVGDMDALRKLMILREIMMEIDLAWHRPFLPFSAGQWNLTDIADIKTSEGKVIGVTFAFKLVKIPWMPGFKFAENNIMIKVRFYNTTVEETVPGTDIKYTVNAGEMKMDLVVNKWKWNIDAIKELIAELQEAGIDIEIPKGKTRLALWVNLASINLEQLKVAKEEPPEEDRIETMSTTSHMELEGELMSVEQNQTQWVGEEGQEKPIIVERPWWAPWQPPEKPVVRLKFAAKDKTLLGFFRFVSSAKVTTPENVTSKVPVRAAYIAAGHHLRFFLGYPYFGNGTLEHDPSIGVDVPGIETTPQYTVQAPLGIDEIAPTVIGKYVLPLFTLELAAVLAGAVSIVAVVIYVIKWKRKTPINMVGAS